MFEDERRDFKTWLSARQAHFDEQNFLPNEIALLALSRGFTELVVRQWEFSQKFKKMEGPHVQS